MKIAILASSTTIFTHSYTELLKSKYEVFLIDLSRTPMSLPIQTYPIIKPTKLKKIKLFARRLIKLLKLDVNPLVLKYVRKNDEYSANSYTDNLIRIVEKEKPDLIFSFWGTTTFPCIKIIKNNFPSIKIAHIVSTYPVREKISWEDRPHFIEEDRLVFDRIDGLIFTSKIMKKYFDDVIKVNKPQKLIFYDSLCESYFSHNRSTQKDQKNKIIFLGNTDFQNRSIDDIRETIYKLTDQKINIYIQEPASGINKNKYIHIFKPFSFDEIKQGKLADFITQFDAVLVKFNDFDDVRTNISIPTRFVLGVTGAIPILIEKGKYFAIEECYKDIAFTYSNEEEIISILTNEKFVSKRTEITETIANEYLEAKADELFKFLEAL